MAKKKKKDTTLYVLLSLIIVLLLVSISIQLNQRNDNLTSWATLHGSNLHDFFSTCRDGGGTVDVRQNSAPDIVFVCDYVDRMVEYTLGRGRP